MEYKEVEEWIRNHPQCADKILKIVSDVMDDWKEQMKKRRDNLSDKSMLMMCSLTMDSKTFKSIKNIKMKKAMLKEIKELHFPEGIKKHANCERDFYKEFIKPLWKE